MRHLAVRTLALCLGVSGFLGMAQGQEVKHLTHVEAAKLAIAKPQPAYPPMAKQLRLEGKVEVEASIGEDGSIESVHALSGNILLSNAAIEATKHWKFPPMQGKAVAVLSFLFKM